MSRTPATAGPGNPGSAAPKRPAAYPASKPAPAPAVGAAAGAPAASAPAKPAAPAPAFAATASPGAKTISKSVSGNLVRPRPDYLTKKNLILGGSVAGALVVLIALLVWRPWSPAPPRLNEQPYKIAQFAASPAMDRLPWSQQREYMDLLNAKDEALLQAYKDGKLDDVQYRRSLQLGWYDKHLDRMEKFFNRPPQLRMVYIDEKVLGKKMQKKGIPVPGKKDPKPKKEEKSDDASPLKPEEIDRDNSTEEQDVKTWPADVRQRWIEYRAALASRKEAFKELEKQEKERRKAGEANAKAAPAGAAPDTANPGAGTGGTPATTGDADKAAGGQ